MTARPTIPPQRCQCAQCVADRLELARYILTRPIDDTLFERFEIVPTDRSVADELRRDAARRRRSLRHPSWDVVV